MKKNCPYCGTELKEVNERLFCPNCGFIEEDKTKGKKDPDYI